MKRLLITVFLLSGMAFSAAHHAAPIDLWFVHRNGCKACRQMKVRMENPSVAKVLKRSYRIRMLNARDLDQLPSQLPRTHLTPTLYFVDSHGRELIPLIHNITTLDFWKLLKKAEDLRDKR
jgi:hypothetical protein